MKSGTFGYLILLLVVVGQIRENECRGRRRPSPSRRPTPSPYRPFPTHRPTYRPFPTHAPTYRPFPTHAPTYRPFPTHAPTHRPFPTHASTYRPFPTHGPTYRPFPTHAPTHRPFPTFAPTYRTYPTPAVTYRTYPTKATTYRTHPTRTTTYRTHPTRAPTYRPHPTRTTTYRPYPDQAPTYRTYPTKTTTHRTRPTKTTTSSPYRTKSPTIKYPSNTYKPSTTHIPYPTQRTTYKPFPTHSSTYRPSPTHRPSSTHYPTMRTTRHTTPYPTQRYPTGPHPTYPGYTNEGIYTPKHYQPSYRIPVRVPSAGGTKIKVYNINNYHSPSYWAPPTYPVYHYTHRDTGSTALGFHIGYNLRRISHPTYYHHQHSFYDGYSPRYDHYTVHHYYHNRESIPRQQTVTTKVIIQCGDSSQICPANTTSLCTASGQIMCVVIASNTVPCADQPNMRCVKSTIPCENNEAPECKGIAKGQTTTVSIPCISNTTIEGNVTTVNNTIVSNDPQNNTTRVLATETTTPQILTTQSTIGDLGNRRRKREAPLEFCVTVIAQPSKRALTEGEQVFNEIASIFDKFFTTAFGMDKQLQKPPTSVKDENYIPKFGG
ncbi:adhesive plaque matrix protein-like [Harmonia axyridis]|uniref:adhesive plaque matrix protein-like n=1 Tax=Harmonia axyridis TaxID=115357 RepID=UPI001E277593|nr:adhesive plaque matrix protein-like [Harmonia axyridis]